MSDEWRKLREGDRVRLVSMPTEFAQPGCFVHRDTLRVYRRLIERRRPVRVAYLDDWKFRGKDGCIEYHSLAINHDGWVLVKSRT